MNAERRRRVGRDHALDRRVRDVALVPERDVFERGDDRGAHDAREPAEVLAQRSGCACAASRSSPSGPTVNASSASPTSRALPVPHVGREPLDARGDERERREERRVPIARDDLRAHRLRRRARARASAALSIVGRRGARTSRRRRRSCRRRSRRARASSRARPRAISAWCPASASPNVTGSAKMPWLRPIIGVFACSRARFASAARSLSQRASKQVGRVAQQDREATCRARRSTSSRDAASAPARPRAPRRASRNAMTSCCVVFSISSMRAGSSTSFFARMLAAVPFGTSSASSIASHAASSTSSQTAITRARSDQSSAKSAGV